VQYDGVQAPILKVLLGSPGTSADDDPGWLHLGTGPGLGVGRLGGISWFDASNDLLALSRQAGQNTEQDASPSPGSATAVLDNRSGIYDPLPSLGSPPTIVSNTLLVSNSLILTAGTSASSGLDIDVGSPMQVVAEFGGVRYPRFFGYIDEITPDLGTDPTVTITASDGLEVLGRAKLPAVAPARDNEATGARIDYLLTQAGWPTSRRALDSGQETCQATGLGDYALPLISQVVETELGILFVDGDGKVTFYDRYRMYREPRSQVVQATLSDSGTDVDIVSVAVTKGRSSLFNEAAITRDGGTEQTARDLPSQATYGIRTFPGAPGTLLRTDAEALDMARWLVGKYKDPSLRVSEVSIEAIAQGMWAAVLTLRPLDRIRVVRDYGPSTLDVQVWVESLSEEIVPFERWDVTITTRQADRFTPLMLGGTSGLGVGHLGF
jgi:hypothetical protein